MAPNGTKVVPGASALLSELSETGVATALDPESTVANPTQGSVNFYI